MERFFVQQGDKNKGRPITTLPVVLNNDLSRLESSTYCLKTFKDIENLKRSQNKGISGGFYAQEYKRQAKPCSLTTMMRSGDK